MKTLPNSNRKLTENCLGIFDDILRRVKINSRRDIEKPIACISLRHISKTVILKPRDNVVYITLIENSAASKQARQNSQAEHGEEGHKQNKHEE